MTAVELPGVSEAPHPPHDDLVLDVRDLRMRYGSVDVLHGVDLTARRGEVLALLGPNGAGKTTTISRNLGLVMPPTMGLIALSGIFYPINGYPGWLQTVAQVFPIYWLGLGMRSALLPDGMAAVELGGSWRHLEMFGVLGLWAVLGLVLAPVVLRRMARRESGSRVAARRERAMQRAV